MMVRIEGPRGADWNGRTNLGRDLSPDPEASEVLTTMDLILVRGHRKGGAVLLVFTN